MLLYVNGIKQNYKKNNANGYSLITEQKACKREKSISILIKLMARRGFDNDILKLDLLNREFPKLSIISKIEYKTRKTGKFIK